MVGKKRKMQRTTEIILSMLIAMTLFMGVPVKAQNAFRMSQFSADEDLKHEVVLSAGPAIPLGNTRSYVPAGTGSSDPIPHGAGMGGSVRLGYDYFLLRQLCIGVSTTGHWYAYDYKAFDYSSADRVIHSGWSMYAVSALVGTRLPLRLYGLYFRADVQVGYALMRSPSIRAIYSSPTIGDTEHRLLTATTKGNFYLAGGVGVQYRFYGRWLCQLNLDYTYMPSAGWGGDKAVQRENGKILQLKLSSFVVSAGIAYSF